jgi:3-oxoacyl-[acyl-carrier protein] reductase
MLLSGMVGMVTGAGTGIGASTCEVLASEGADVCVCGVGAEGLEQTGARVRALGRNAYVAEMDVTKWVEVERTVADAVKALGSISVLVNNAAIYPERPWHEITEESWDEVFAVNVKGAFLCSKAVYPVMKRAGGSIINIASTTVLQPWEGWLDYTASKGAIVTLTRGLARELGPHNIRVNTIAPGSITTKGEAAAYHGDEKAFQTYEKRIVDLQCVKRRGVPTDVANAILFFASPLSSFISGQLLYVNGGRTFA